VGGAGNQRDKKWFIKPETHGNCSTHQKRSKGKGNKDTFTRNQEEEVGKDFPGKSRLKKPFMGYSTPEKRYV